LLCEDAELERELGEEDRGVHVAEVVGGVDGGLVDVELLATDDFDRGKADEEQGSSPETGDEVLLAAGFIPEAAEKGDASKKGSGEADEGDQEEVGEPAEGERGLL
jgi:hypothetical protein